MKKLFNISDEERQRILEMHTPKKTISEQTLMPTAQDIKRGALINLYDEKNKLDKRFILLNIVQDLNGVVRLKLKSSQTDLAGKTTQEQVKVMFRCADEFLQTDIEKEGTTSDEVIKYKSDSLVKQMRKNFCQKNNAGQWVPKAAFASSGMDSGQATV